MKNVIIKLIMKEVGLDAVEVADLIEVSPRMEMGDFAFPCFSLAKKLKKNPMAIAKDLAEKFRKELPGEISSVDFKGAYVNFFIDKKILAEDVLAKVKRGGFGRSDLGEGERVVIDMSSPNIAKPFGIGHLRSTIIGNSIGKICEANGFGVTKINYLGDWGTQFGKIIFGFKKWGSEMELKKNPIKHLYELYVKANAKVPNGHDPAGLEFEKEARKEFKKLEEGDKENIGLWEKFRKLSLKEFDKIYDLLGIEFDVISGESFYNDKMGEVIDKLEGKNLVKKDDGAMIVDLKEEGLGVALIQKSDGTSLYVTRDLAAALDRYKEYKFDKMIYEVGQEQRLHFKQVFKILEKMGYDWAGDCIHATHGLYLDNDGKKFATRKGKTVFMKDILGEVVERAKVNLTEREKLPVKVLDERARKIALAAIFYGDLKNFRENNMIFDIDKFLAFEGDTGPYLLYSYARASSIVRKVRSKKVVKIVDLKNSEIKLLKKIDGFEDVVQKAYENLAPNLIANYCFELAQSFNEFYHACPVLGSEKEGFRLKLVDAFRIILGKGLGLLGIETIEEM
ncbi:arginine--tRNA ligase [Candidatus Pacearchaeota archaeon]|nr:arginine--tRNA ligase [Candidatus Pacearchaeota archaeon]